MPRTTTTTRPEPTAQRGLFENAPAVCVGTALPSRDSRRRTHLKNLDAQAERSSSGPSLPSPTAADRAKDAIRRELLVFIRSIGVGERFTAVDFTNWLDTTGQGHVRDSIDLRATGGMFVALIRAGVIAKVGHGPNGGGTGTMYSSTDRPFYEVRKLDFSTLGWPKSEPRGIGRTAEAQRAQRRSRG